MTTGHTYHFPEPPEFYVVDDNLHVVDRIKGEVALHKIYPASALDKLNDRTRHLRNVAELILLLNGAPGRKKPKKPGKPKRRK